jgi:hypothetical protein
VCRSCGADLHVCRICRFFEPGWRQGCREERAEDVRDREGANFCDYLEPRAGAHQPAGDSDAARAARAELDALFGGSTGQGERQDQGALSPEERARRELDRLFGTDDKDRSTE